MLQRLYVHNFRCLVNFELKLDRLNLLLGVNGSGKSSVFDVLRKLQDFVLEDALASQAFPLSDKTLWLALDTQSFEIDIAVSEAVYSYKLEIQHDKESQKTYATKEELHINQKPLFIYNNDVARLYRDDHTEGAKYPFNMMTRSGVGFLNERKDNRLLSQFKHELERFIIVKPMPALMERQSPNENRRLEKMMENFPSWYRFVSPNTEFNIKLASVMAEVLPGFRSFDLSALGESSKLLKIVFNNPSSQGKPFSLNFSDLSDGQKMLVVLYALLCFSSLQDCGISLFIDEPDNFVALREIQPWLLQLIDECGDTIEQAVLISHHPEMIDYLGGDGCGQWFARDKAHHIRVSKDYKHIDGLSLSETMARGWE
jgi:predicted ATPase